MRFGRLAIPALTLLLAATAATERPARASGQASSPSPAAVEQARLSRDIPIDETASWTSTDIQLQAGERAVFTAKGTGHCPGEDAEFGPGGIPRGFRDLLRVLPMSQAGRGALLGRIGAAAVAQPFLIGPSTEVVTPVGGALAIGINRSDSDACTAAFTVHVEVFPPKDGAARVARRVDSIEGAGRDLFTRLPRRVGDKQGNPGDMVNFLLLGSEAAMTAVFKGAGWVTVDSDVRGALIAGVLDSFKKEAYLTLPMSQLYLFDRPQDFGWAHAEPIKVVESRHHLRVWRAPYAAGSSVLWVGAATHDIGFDRDQRNNGVTHKIDPKVDDERDFVEQTLTGTGLVSKFTYVTPADPVRQAKTATGGTFQSDGRVLVMRLDTPQ